MKKKYYDRNIEGYLLKNTCWEETDFIKTKRILLSDHQLTDYSNGKEIKGIDISTKNVYIFSEPVSYKNKNTLVFIVYFGIIPNYEMRKFLVVMKKNEKNGKWIEIERIFYR